MFSRCTFLTAFLFFVMSIAAQNSLQQQAIVIKRTVELRHVQPRFVDDVFSGDLFNFLIDHIDHSKVFLTKDDIASLEKYRNRLDDELNGKEWNFLTNLKKLYEQRVKQVQAFISNYAKPFDFNLAATYTPQKDDRSLNEKALQDRWTTILKMETLNGLVNIAQSELSLKNTIDKAKILAREPEQRVKAKAKELNKIKSFLEPADHLEKMIDEAYLNAMVMCFDPHSNYFDLDGKKYFQTALNTDGYFYGFYLDDNEKDEVYINHLIPGSVAWACGKLNKGDVLIKLQWLNKQAVDAAGLTAEEINHLIDINGDKLELTVRKVNGKAETVALQKQKIENDDNIVKGFVLNGEKKIGYINLPSFYTEWEDQQGSRCASDVAKEVIRLKKEGIEGLILDVRSNAGGAINEAVEMAGIFVDEGPMCLLKPRVGKTITLKDMNRGSIFDDQ